MDDGLSETCLDEIIWTSKRSFGLLRPYLTSCCYEALANILHNLAAKYDQKLSIAELRLFEKTSTKARKARLDVNFLKNCQSLYVFPRFISFALPNTSAKEVKAIRKRLLRSAIEKRSKELKWLENERDKISNKLRTILNSFDLYLLRNALQSNIYKLSSKIVETHAKKLRNLTRHTILPFNADETVTNMSSHHLSSEQYKALKNGLTLPSVLHL